tara:strand:- start:34 stop:423 length:390 start_codon:yes stop_codon:yes gene_type:complete
MTLTEVFKQATILSPTSYMMDDQVVIHNGMKIRYNNGDVRVFDTTRGGANYTELEFCQYQLLMDYGWLEGVNRIKVNAYQQRIDRVSEKIRESVTSGGSINTIEQLKNRRIQLTKSWMKSKKLIENGTS